MEQIIRYIQTIYPISDALKTYLSSVLKERTVPKKQFLLRAGHVCRHISFITKGMVRCFYISNSIEISSWFMKEGDFVISVESFFLQKESRESIQALENCELLSIEYNELENLYRTFPEFNYIGRVLTERYYILSEQRLYSLRMQAVAARYKHVMEHYPELINRVPSKHIASYLGTTEQNLSRIRSKR